MTTVGSTPPADTGEQAATPTRAPGPTERAAAPAPGGAEKPTARGPSPAPAPAKAREPSRRERKQLGLAAANASRAPLRRMRHRVKKFDLWSVLKISLCFYLCAMAVLILAGVFLWLFIDSLGYIGNAEKFMGNLFNSNDYKVVAPLVLEGAALIGLVLAALLVVITVVGAALYNVFSELLGGIEFTTIEEELRPRRK